VKQFHLCSTNINNHLWQKYHRRNKPSFCENNKCEGGTEEVITKQITSSCGDFTSLYPLSLNSYYLTHPTLRSIFNWSTLTVWQLPTDVLILERNAYCKTENFRRDIKNITIYFSNKNKICVRITKSHLGWEEQLSEKITFSGISKSIITLIF